MGLYGIYIGRHVMATTNLTMNSSTLPKAPSTAWKEVYESGEEELFERFAAEIAEAQQKKVAQETGGPARRGFHAKQHVGLLAEFEVLDDLPEYARQGVFSEPRVFPAVVRFSNGDFHVNPDKKFDSRGIAVKLVGVPGPKLLEGQREAVTQDFLATVNSSAGVARNIWQFVALVRAGRKPATLPFTLAREVGLFESVRMILTIVRLALSGKARSLATEQYSSTSPIKFGPYAVMFTIRPAEGTEEPTGKPETDDPDYLRGELAGRLRKGDLLFDFLVQFYVDDKRTPIEDSSVRWKPEDTPFLNVGRLRIPRCDLDDPATSAQSESADRLLFTPWHTVEDHRPLGNMMRSRKIVYQKSAAFRGHAPEPRRLPL